MRIPDEVNDKIDLNLKLFFPKKPPLILTQKIPTLLYNYYNLDPNWRTDEKCNRILILEPIIFDKYPVSQTCIDFILKLSNNIQKIQIYVGNFNQLKKDYGIDKFIFKEHPLNKHYTGMEDERDWLYKVEGEYLSFLNIGIKLERKLSDNNFLVNYIFL